MIILFKPKSFSCHIYGKGSLRLIWVFTSDQLPSFDKYCKILDNCFLLSPLKIKETHREGFPNNIDLISKMLIMLSIWTIDIYLFISVLVLIHEREYGYIWVLHWQWRNSYEDSLPRGVTWDLTFNDLLILLSLASRDCSYCFGWWVLALKACQFLLKNFKYFYWGIIEVQ